MRKGSKNIWSLCVNENTLDIITGWADGGLRKFELKNYLCVQNAPTTNLESDLLQINQVEWNPSNSLEKDYIRDVLIMNERILCCTNLGCLYVTDTLENFRESGNQKLILKSDLLINYNVMAKVKMHGNDKQWCLTIGSLKGN